MMHFVPLFLVCILSLPAFQATELTKCKVSHAIKDIDGYQGISLLECEFILRPCFLPFPPLPSPPSLSPRGVVSFAAVPISSLSSGGPTLKNKRFLSPGAHLIPFLDLAVVPGPYTAFYCL